MGRWPLLTQLDLSPALNQASDTHCLTFLFNFLQFQFMSQFHFGFIHFNVLQ